MLTVLVGAHIALDEDRLPARLLDRGDCVAALPGINVEDSDGRPHLGQPNGYSAANSGCGPAHRCDLAFQRQ
jgi:hypothetical protein